MNAPTQCERWVRVATNLRADRKDKIAPHKPLLLLVVAVLGEEVKFEQPVFPLAGELTFRFLAFWTAVTNRRKERPAIRLPISNLQYDVCWTPLDDDGKPTTERRRVDLNCN
jgi:hypothetical protein